MKFLAKLLIFIFSINGFHFANDLNNTIISGTIYNCENTYILINQQAVYIDSQGQFTYTLDLQKPAYFKIEFGQRIYLYLHPNKNIHLEIDAKKDIRMIKLEGDQIIINKHLLNEEYESQKTSTHFNQHFRDIVTLEEESFVKKINQIWRPFEERFDSFIRDNEIHDSYFNKTQQATLAYSKASILIRYPEWYRSFTGNIGYNPSGTYYSFLEQLNLNDDEIIDIEEYTNFLHHYIDFKSIELQNSSKNLDYKNYVSFRAKIQVIMDYISNPVVRTEMLYTVMKSLLGEYYHKGIDDLVLMFRKNCTNKDYLDDINQMLENDQFIREQCQIKTYKQIGKVNLDAFVYMPPNIKQDKKKPVIAFFHGGGWECGKPEWGHMQCEHFSSLGLVAISFEYRLETQHGTTPLECISDARSAIRWIRENSGELNIDPERIVASGFSAGGHIALCTTMIDQFDDPMDDLSINPPANAFLLWVTPAKIYDGIKPRLRARAAVQEIDPARHIRSDLPPMVFFQGTVDNMVPPESIKDFAREMKAAGNRCDLHLYEGQTHLGWGENNKDVLKKMDMFLESIGYIRI